MKLKIPVRSKYFRAMNFNDYQSKGFDTSFHYAQDYSTTPRKTTGYPAIGNPVIYPGRW